MAIDTLSSAALHLFTKLIQGPYALYQPSLNGGSGAPHYLAFAPQVVSVGLAPNPTKIESFWELWGQGYLYLAGKTAVLNTPTVYFLLTGTARLLWKVRAMPPKQHKPSREQLAILRLMAQGNRLQVSELNGPHTRWKCQLKGKIVLRSAVAQTFVKHGWVKPTGLPTNPEGNLSCWQWRYELSEAGRTLVEENAQGRLLAAS